MARKRSWNELYDVVKYVRKRNADGRGGQIFDNAESLAERYMDKIAFSRSGRKYDARYKAANKAKDAKKAEEIRNIGLNRKYSERTYKGLVGG